MSYVTFIYVSNKRREPLFQALFLSDPNDGIFQSSGCSRPIWLKGRKTNPTRFFARQTRFRNSWNYNVLSGVINDEADQPARLAYKTTFSFSLISLGRSFRKRCSFRAWWSTKHIIDKYMALACRRKHNPLKGSMTLGSERRIQFGIPRLSTGPNNNWQHAVWVEHLEVLPRLERLHRFNL